ncbi:Dps family protein [Candidatus Xianfuyuplasma coldseepsis]|uniref:DNA starvation/stationary phase protection protein n=1 Tax=Candidatus Xianfuyuplasma coldseepsis TaxID=2782163 RepID=A0A7L7KU30_9MOLU|nr:DNA starvation/stationary phase protection protein [Xianfuyuplasma coldseepsis]QMS85514.1 DNA starvation/stationary phase protection protein [Xianfuyuplasma coldseepsis]
MKQTELMNKYVADLAVLNVKFHNLHWNVVGENFETVHVYIEKLYDDLFLKFDEVAERIKMLGEFPKASLASYLELTTIEELDNKDYAIEETFKILQVELKTLKQMAHDIRLLADDNDDFVTVALMEDHIGAYDKEIWFIKQTLK